MSELDVFAIALDLTDPAERAAYLEKACGGDALLRQRIELLLNTHARAGDFLARPAAPAATVEEEAQADAPSLGFLQPSERADSLGRLGHYEVLEVVGNGAFGTVLKALDDRLRRVVAIKVLSPQIATTSPPRKRFLREARAAAAVKHDNVVQVYAVEEQPVPYIVMEFIAGQTLQQRLDAAGPLDLTEVLTFGRQIAEGLAAAHEQGLVHRDVKPANILIETGVHPRVKLTDFGLARAADDASMTASGVILGTPLYMSPEQAHGRAIDHRSDLFSLGSVLYTMVSGRPPFRAASTLAVLRRVAEETPRPIREIIPEAPAWLCDLITRLHAKKPEDRVQTAREVADLLGGWAAGRRGGDPIRRPAERVEQEAAPPQPEPAGAGRWLVVALVGIGSVLAILKAGAVGTDLVRLSLTAVGAGGLILCLVISLRGGRVHPPPARRAERTASPQSEPARPEEGHFPLHVVPLIFAGAALVLQFAGGGASGPISVLLTAVTVVGLLLWAVGHRRSDSVRRPQARKVEEVAAQGKRPDRRRGVRFLGCLFVVAAVAFLIAVSWSADGFYPQPPRPAPEPITKPRPVIGDPDWERRVLTLPPLQQVEAVTQRLRLLNPGFREEVKPTIEDLVVKGLQFRTEDAGDIAAVRGLPGLERLICRADPGKGMVSDLLSLTGMRLKELDCSGNSRITDLSPLRGMPLEVLKVNGCGVADFSPLRELPLRALWADLIPGRAAEVVRSIPTLKEINGEPVAMFLKRVEKPGTAN